jgi:sensor histidine kinase YesM
MIHGSLFRSRFFIVLLHSCVWAIIFILPLFFERSHLPPVPPGAIPKGIGSRGNFETAATLLNVSFIPLFYFNGLFLVPRFFNRQHWPRYVLLVSLSIAAVIGLNMAARTVFTHGPGPVPFRIIILLSVFILITSTAFSFIQKNFRAEKLQKEREAENLKTELSFLRSQVSPHFLFNTLNNLVSLARKKSDLLEPSLLKLSGLLQYMLYESDDEKISIHKEIDYLDNYVELQKLRFGDDIKISFFKEVQPDSFLEVVPMILIPFVENAFKHGVGMIKDPEINIRLAITGNLLNFSVRNKFNPGREEKDKSSGIGLINVKRRLDLLYPDSRLEIYHGDHMHTVTLSIILEC